ncbi:glycosyltransferase involved in cell wall biosynthesis [Rhodovulum bhavnagarense]|uniref:Glycosyltransferase involved in cell wall biosynthesis n=1 Tax=Rhodovulum bhavnagarense TaxID=992286 RepID=A0A4R2R5X7_9RHOB|nr:glycosyltransferase [Rhodovulum bhavnagarense]TCP58410.1 glycosyltransferase involved in cell wall biosynthesis [Rhodovulum bhavnagarense]
MGHKPSSNRLSREELLDSGFFDADWYSSRYTDVRLLGMDPLDHYLWLGERLNRSPGPRFDASAYLATHQDVARAGVNPLLHYLRTGRSEGRRIFATDTTGPSQVDTAPRLTRGNAARRPGRPTVLLCSHIAGRNLFGGERSLLDVLDGLNALDFNVIVTVPGIENSEYFEILRNRSRGVYVLPYRWWREGVPVNEKAVAGFARIIADEGVDIVHSNTIVLREPLIAARRMGVRTVVHVRELIQHDTTLLQMIGEDAETIVAQTWARADLLIANSEATRAAFALPGKDPVRVYNTADFDTLTALPPPVNHGPMRVGLISSNIPKKGIEDFAQIAGALARTHPQIVFHLIGPETEHTARLMERVTSGELPSNLKMLGYRDTPAKAIAEADVIVSLSRFRESFGRTVLEGMAAGRPAIVYDHGAPPEIVRDGQTGFIVPFGDNGAVARALQRLADDRESLIALGERARTDVAERFNRTAYATQMRTAYDRVIDIPVNPQKMTLRARADLAPKPRNALKIGYFCWHFPVPSETFVLNELRLLRARGVDVRVFCRQSPHADFKPDFDIEWERVTSPDHLAQRLVEMGITNVHAHFVYPTVTDMVWPACEKAGIPFTCIAHAQDIFRYGNAANNRIDEFSKSPLCQKVFTLSRFHRDYLEKRGVPGNKLVINSNCIDPDLFAPGKVPERAARKSRRICAVARFTEKKGLETLIRAGKLLEPDGILIDLYGYGELEEAYRRIIAKEKIGNVTLHGPVESRDALLDVYRQHDLFVCPSLRAHDGDMDGIPTTILESIAAGLPVLTTDIAGIPDLVSDLVTGLVAEANPQALADRVRAFYALPDCAVQSLIVNAEARLRRHHNGPDLVENLLRVWANETLDLMIVSWNNLAQTSEVIRRLIRFTSLPYHLIICDNGSDAPALAHLLEIYGTQDNVTLVLNRENAFVGPGTNICLAQGRSDYAIYVCGKEGMVTRHGWEKNVLTYMNANPRVGLAGTQCYAPSYLYGRDYPKAQPLFDKFRNPSFALTQAARVFTHVQGGFFVMRRAMVDEIGGFSTEVPHASTDVEYSYYVESRGWELGEVPGLMSLFNKTRPGLFHRIDEHMGALHPPRLENLPALDAIAQREVVHCNACGQQSDLFHDLDGDARCPRCGADRRARSIHRALAESTLLYRRLPALSVDLPQALEPFWREQFQGRVEIAKALESELTVKGRTDLADGRLSLILLNGAQALSDRIVTEAARLLAPGGTLMIAGTDRLADLTRSLAERGLSAGPEKRFESGVSHYDWFAVLHFTKTDHP